MPSDRQPRRRFLRTAGGAAALALAGCSGGNDGTTDEPATDTPRSSGTDRPDGTAASASGSANRGSLALPTVAAGSSGGEVRLRPEGEPSFVNFFATWCGPCKDEMPDLREVRAAFDADRVHMVSVTPEADEAAVRQFWETYEGTWPVAMDVDLRATSRWGVSSYPTNKLFDAEGNELGYTGLRHYEDIAPAIESELDGD